MKPDATTLSGAVLAGGYSTRMGRDKARLSVASEPLWRRQRCILTEAGAGRVVFALRPGQRRFAPELEIVRDTWRGIGPMAGLHAALSDCRTAWLAVVAVDLPRVEAEWFRRLAQVCEPGRGAVGVNAEGFFEPFAAIYPREAQGELARAAQSGRHSLQPVLRALVRAGCMRTVRISARDAGALFNWNCGPLPE